MKLVVFWLSCKILLKSMYSLTTATADIQIFVLLFPDLPPYESIPESFHWRWDWGRGWLQAPRGSEAHWREMPRPAGVLPGHSPGGLWTQGPLPRVQEIRGSGLQMQAHQLQVEDGMPGGHHQHHMLIRSGITPVIFPILRISKRTSRTHAWTSKCSVCKSIV